MAYVWPEDVARDLHRLLGNVLAERSLELLDRADMSLVVEMMRRLGRPPSTTEYDSERDRLAAQGEKHPDRTTISTAYGHWGVAMQRATKVWKLGSNQRRWKKTKDEPKCAGTHEEAVDALRHVRWLLGEWPHSNEYTVMRLVAFDAAREARWALPILPPASAISKRFDGDYTKALRAAIRAHQEAGEPDGSPLAAR